MNFLQNEKFSSTWAHWDGDDFRGEHLWWFPIHWGTTKSSISIQDGAPKIAKLVFISGSTMVHGRYNELVHGDYNGL